MQKRLLISALVMSAICIGLSGCVTNALWQNCDFENGCSDTYTKRHLILSDEYFAIGKPKTPVAGFEHALVLIGKKSTLILTPQDGDDLKFFQSFHKFNMKDLTFHDNHYSIKIENDDLSNTSSDIDIWFERKVEFPVTPQEESLLKELGFILRSAGSSIRKDGHYFEYQKNIGFNITPAQALPYVNLQHTFRQPISFEFYKEEMSRSKTKAVLNKLFLPAIVIDVVTLPIQVVGYLVYEGIKD